MKDMYGHVNRATLRRGAIDFALALMLFWLLTFALSTHDGKAHAVPLYANPQGAQTTPEKVNRLTLLSFETAAAILTFPMSANRWALLSLAFALLVALNLAIWRHLRRAYASPRRGVWRRG